MKAAAGLERRTFLKTGAAVGGGLLIGFSLPSLASPALAQPPKPPQYPPDAFVRIGRDESVTILANKSEMGQGIYTALAMLVCEELECDWSRVRVESAPVAAVYNHAVFGMQMTGGSSSVWSSWDQLRTVGATARELLIAAAAAQWAVEPRSCRAANGFVLHAASGRKASFGSLSEAAAKLPPPQAVPLKEEKDFKLIGKPVGRLDTAEKVDGRAVFGLDVSVPGMLTAVVARPPVFGGRALQVKDAKARVLPGVKQIASVPSGVAVIAEGFWSATRARDALEIEWDEGESRGLSSQELRRRYAALARTPGLRVHVKGAPEDALKAAPRSVEAEYEVPYLAHAMMEPLNCVVDLRAGSCEIWTGTQFQTVDRNAAALAAGLAPEQVQIHTTFLGGGFGRRANPSSDFVVEAVNVAKAANAPVKVVWTREDDIRGGYYRPMWHSRFAAGLDAAGKTTAWHHTIVGQSILAGTAFESAMVKDGIDRTSIEGASDLPYDIPNQLVELHSPKLGVPVLWWRSVGHSHTAFAVESFLDELAHAAGRDPYQYRRDLLAGQPRHLGVLELAVEKSGWRTPPPEGRARGLALHASFGSFVAQVAEVSLAAGELHVHRVVCAIDCGRIVNPNTIAAQMEGGVAFGLSAALHGEITLDKGRVQQSNFHDYPLLRHHEMPEVEVHIVPSREKPGGVGEPGTPPIAPAVCNALFRLTGKRVRRLPIRLAELNRA